MNEEKNGTPETEQEELQTPVPEENTIQPEEPVAPPAEEPTVIYRWDYDEEQKANKKRKGKSALAFATTVSCAFLIVIGLLIGVLAFRDSFSKKFKTMDTTQIAEKLLPSTVLIIVSNGTAGSSGSGFFISQDGLIATNYHVVEGMTTINVKVYGSNQFLDARVVGSNAECDLAVLKVEGTGYPAVSFGNSDALRVGEVAVAIGNPSGKDAAWTVTQGVISSVDRELTVETTTEFLDYRMIQTDAAVNPGNSGGLLCNGQGEVIGIVARKPIYKQIVTGTGTTADILYEGIGYAIPGNGAKEIIDGIIKAKTVDPISAGLLKRRPKIGITVSPIKKGEDWSKDGKKAPANGLLIVESKTSSGLEEGDIIVSFKGKKVADFETFIDMLYSCKRGDKVSLVVYKFGQTTPTTIELVIGT